MSIEDTRDQLNTAIRQEDVVFRAIAELSTHTSGGLNAMLEMRHNLGSMTPDAVAMVVEAKLRAAEHANRVVTLGQSAIEWAGKAGPVFERLVAGSNSDLARELLGQLSLQEVALSDIPNYGDVVKQDIEGLTIETASAETIEPIIRTFTEADMSVQVAEGATAMVLENAVMYEATL